MSANKKNGRWASDEDTNSLLAGILDETETAAAREQAALESKLDAQRQAEAIAHQAAEQARREVAKARIEKEADRQRQLEARRTSRMQAIQIETLKPAEEEVALAPNRAQHSTPSPEELQAQLENLQERMVQLQTHTARHEAIAPSPAARKSSAPYIALAAILSLLIGASAILGAVSMSAYSPDQTSYSTVTMQPKDERQPITLAAIMTIKPEPKVVAAPTRPKERERVRRPTRKPRTPKPVKPRPVLEGLDFDTDASLFGEAP